MNEKIDYVRTFTATDDSGNSYRLKEFTVSIDVKNSKFVGWQVDRKQYETKDGQPVKEISPGVYEVDGAFGKIHAREAK